LERRSGLSVEAPYQKPTQSFYILANAHGDIRARRAIEDDNRIRTDEDPVLILAIHRGQLRCRPSRRIHLGRPLEVQHPLECQ
jgi:hypothetical protein